MLLIPQFLYLSILLSRTLISLHWHQMTFIHTLGSTGRYCWPRVILSKCLIREVLKGPRVKWRNRDPETVNTLLEPEPTSPDPIYKSSSVTATLLSQIFFESVKFFTWLCNMIQNITEYFTYCHLIQWVIERKMSIYYLPTPQVLI